MEEVRGRKMRGEEGEGGKRMEVGRWVEEVRGGKMCGGVRKR
jgi:hypothetical protein